MRVVTSASGGSGEPPLPRPIKIFALSVFFALLTSTSTSAELRTVDCVQAAKYSESKRGISMLIMQNRRTVFEHYANGGSPDGKWPIFSGTKSFWGIAALCAVREGLIKLDDHAADTIKEWKSDPRKAQIVSLRYFAGLSVEETAAALDLSPATIKNEWAFARAWLYRALGPVDSSGTGR